MSSNNETEELEGLEATWASYPSRNRPRRKSSGTTSPMYHMHLGCSACVRGRGRLRPGDGDKLLLCPQMCLRKRIQTRWTSSSRTQKGARMKTVEMSPEVPMTRPRGRPPVRMSVLPKDEDSKLNCFRPVLERASTTRVGCPRREEATQLKETMKFLRQAEREEKG